MFIGLGQLEAPSLAAASSAKPVISGIKDLDAVELAITSAMAISGPLASSPSENTPMRRSLDASLQQTAGASGKYAETLTKLGWTAEPQAFRAIKDDTEKLAALLSVKPSPSWAILDAGVRAIQGRLNSARTATFSRASSEAESATSHARGLIVGFVATKPMSESDWAGVAKLADAVQADVNRINTLPLGPAAAPLYLGAGRQLQTEIDARLEAVSTGFMNTTESLARQAGMAPQRGRRVAAWTERNKWPILGAISAGVAVEWLRRRGK